MGFLAAMNRASGAATPVSQPGVTEPNAEPTAIPAGTHLLMKLISPLHTTSSTSGSGVYLETAFPVVANGRVVIPEHTRVMGVVADERRPGRVQGRAQMQLRFTQLILPDNRTLSIVGSLQSLPGSHANRTVDRQGTLEPVDQIDADVYTIAGAAIAGGMIGTIGRPGLGTGIGALTLGGLGLAKVLFTRGGEISLPEGTRVEMVLHHPVTVLPAPLSTLAANRTPDSPRQSERPSILKEQTEHPRRDNIPCLRDGVTLRCVTPETVTVSQAKPVDDH